MTDETVFINNHPFTKHEIGFNIFSIKSQENEFLSFMTTKTIEYMWDDNVTSAEVEFAKMVFGGLAEVKAEKSIYSSDDGCDLDMYRVEVYGFKHDWFENKDEE